MSKWSDLDLKDKSGETALSRACGRDKSLDLIKSLLDNGANPNVVDNDYELPIQKVVEGARHIDPKQQVESVKLLIEHKSIIPRGFFHACIKSRNVELVKTVLEHKDLRTDIDHSGKSAIWTAIVQLYPRNLCSLEMIELLINWSQDLPKINLKDEE